jgi:polar amino acid transport system substrate-binding protein
VNRLTWLVVPGLLVASLILSSCGSSANAPAASIAPSASITVGIDARWPPFSSQNKLTQQFEGFEIDIMNAITEKENLLVEYKNQPYDTLLAGMTQGLYDAAISSIVITEDLKKEMLFTDPYFAAGPIVVVLQSNTTITGKDTLAGNVGALKGTLGAAVVTGQYPENFKTAGGVFLDEGFGIAVTKSRKDLLNKLNNGLKAIRSEGMLDTFARKWFQAPKTPDTKTPPPVYIP